ncbi:hypothetical protein [Nocardia macrotermitis]|uniref:hypothetical protein n=1 Tax=Nocardia macrotermitis TaxID=2585198 RepID=UPI001296352A|nr:hypothetical protein [Nocardia macrotermitis]
MSKFEVDDVFRVSFQKLPIVTGFVQGEFTVGQQVELTKRDGRIYRGAMTGMHIRTSPVAPNHFSITFSEPISDNVEPGDVITTIDPDQHSFRYFLAS